MSPFAFTHAIARAPARSVVDGLRAHDGEGPDYDGVAAEHAAYVAALGDAGVEVEVLAPLEAYPDSVFVEDPALVFGEGAVLLRPGAPTRAGETAELASTLQARFERVLTLGQGFADGGDVLVAPREVLIGLSARTDPAGARSLSILLAELGRTARTVAPPPGVLHLKTACALLDEETVLATGPLVAAGLFPGMRVLTVPAGEEAAANLIRVGDRVLAAAGHPRTLDLIDAHGLAVTALSTREISKIDAGLSCMSLRWRASP